jgi:hypothetical protein
VPALPVISLDFLTLYELKYPDVSPKEPRLEKYYSHDYKCLLGHGDRLLADMTSHIVIQLFGANNKALNTLIIHDWVANTNWMMLAVSYRLDRYLGWFPKSYRKLLSPGSIFSENLMIYRDKKKGKIRKDMGEVKYWGDIWEAYWGSLMSERELWNEDTEDIESIFRQLISFKYSELLSLYSMVGFGRRNFPVLKMIEEKDIEVKAVKRSDRIFTDCLGIHSEKSEETTYGYLAEIWVPTNISPRKIMTYAIHEKGAKELALLDANYGISSTNHTLISCY